MGIYCREMEIVRNRFFCVNTVVSKSEGWLKDPFIDLDVQEMAEII